MLAINLSVGKQYNNYSTGTWYSYGSGVYYTDFAGNYTEKADPFDDAFEVVQTLPPIASVKYNNIDLLQVTDIDTLQLEPSFYAENASGQAVRVYIRLPHFAHPDFYNINVGVSNNFSTEEYIDDDDNIYIPRIETIGTVGLERDKVITNDTISFDRFSVSLNNRDRYFDNFNSWDIYKQQVKTDAICNGLKISLHKGYIWNYKINKETLDLEIVDIRKGLDDNITETVYTKTAFANLHDDDVDKPQPIRYGLCQKVSVLCVNRGSYNQASAQTLTFHVANTSRAPITSIDTFYIDDVSKTFGGVSLTDGTFTYSKAAGEAIDFNKCKVTLKGYTVGGLYLQNPADIVKDLLLWKRGTNFIPENYNIDTWNRARSLLYNAYLDAVDGTLIEAINNVMRQNAAFVIDPDGKFSLTKQDESAEVKYSIPKEHIINLDRLSESYDTDEVHSSIKIHYGNGRRYLYNTNEQSIFDKYRTKKLFEYESSVVSLNDTQTLAQELNKTVGQLRPIYEITVPACYYPDIRFDDIIEIEADREKSEWRGIVRTIVEGWSFGASDDTLTIKCRYVGDTITQAFLYGQTELYGLLYYGADIPGLPQRQGV